MRDEVTQMIKVAEAARRLREHELSILDLLSSGEYKGPEFYRRKTELQAALDVELIKWEAFSSQLKDLPSRYESFSFLTIRSLAIDGVSEIWENVGNISSGEDGSEPPPISLQT